jgi:iron complex outermembrane receptor protein
MWRPEGYDPYHRWESTTTYNVGLDYGFLQGKIYGAIDLYYKWTKDLLNKIYLPLGSNFTNQIIKNIGSMANKGLEFSINYIPVDTKNWNVDLGLNVTITDTKIKKLILNDNDTSFPGSPTGEDISGGTGNKIQRNIVGYSPYSFYVYEQNYDANGKLIEGSYVDRSGDGKINEDDMYAYKSPEPVAFIGFNANITWKNLTLSTSLRSSLGNYLYNNIASDIANYSQVLNPNNFLSNTIDDIYSTNIYARQLISDYYIQNASFLKMDYLSLGYDFSEFIKVVKLSISFTVQNVFTLTKYTGIDPEIAGGMDKNIYPYPRTFSLGIKLQY